MYCIENFLFDDLSNSLSIAELESNLNRFLKFPCRIELDEQKQLQLIEERVLIYRICNIKIIVNYDEHSPPHFHVSNNDFDVSFSILDCNLLKGSLDSRIERKIKYWYLHGGRKRLIEIWNLTRPTNCEVGFINEN